MADPTLAVWPRAPFPPTKPLGPRNPWSYNRATGVLHCDATDVHGTGGGRTHIEIRDKGPENQPLRRRTAAGKRVQVANGSTAA